MRELPNTLTRLQTMLANGDITLQEAGRLQAEQFARRTTKLGCVTHSLTPRWSTDGPLAGIGLAHKDVFQLKDWQPGEGNHKGKAAPGLPPAVCIDRLEKNGAAHLGTLFMTEYACGATAENAQLPPCFNPIDADLVLGGSSGGSGAAVASGATYASLCTDTAGSVRIPAFTCGVMGLKTTHGLVPIDGVGALAPSLDSVGIISRSARDTEAVLDVIVDKGLLRPAPDQLHIKAWLPEAELDPAVITILKAFLNEQPLISTLSTLPHEKEANRLLTVVLAREVYEIHRTSLQHGKANRQVTDLGLLGAAMPQSWYASALEERPAMVERFIQDVMLNTDVLLMPAHGLPLPIARRVYQQSPDFDAKSLLSLHRYMGFINYLGLPALVMPIGKDDNGYPVSVQAIAKPFQERSLLKFALSVELSLFGDDGIPSINNL